MVKVKVFNISTNELPQYATSGDAGIDVHVDFSRVTSDDPVKIYGGGWFSPKTEDKPAQLYLKAGSRALMPTGLFVGIPLGYEIQVRPRSGLALKQGITVINTPGTIDSGYRGECKVIIINTSNSDVCIEHGMRICQFVLNKVEQIDWDSVDSKEELGTTERNDGGFGHSGIK